MPSVAVRWGYGEDADAWNADAVIDRPADLIAGL
jgi:phosphoglycolate phosphatase-like HAD superfamily hydrolase